jgi:hypothetical protein
VPPGSWLGERQTEEESEGKEEEEEKEMPAEELKGTD